MSVTAPCYDGAMVKVGDVVEFLDNNGTPRVGEVTAYVEDAGYGFEGFVAWDPIIDGHLWGYTVQITRINGDDLCSCS